MARHGSVQSSKRRFRAGISCSRLLWISRGLLMLALFATLLFPAFPSLFRYREATRAEQRNPQQQQLDEITRAHGLAWTREMPLHLSRNVQSKEMKNILDPKKLWKHPPNRGFEPCVSRGKSYQGPMPSRGYLVLHANGGLNQMRAGICDMVAVARLINATLVIPELDKRSFWQDSSKFSDVFDEEYFIKALEHDIPVVRKLPKELISAPKANKQFRSWSNVKYYKEEIVQLWKDYKVIRATKSDSRLANNNLPSSIQKLRCRVHYDALRFAPAIEALGRKLVERMRLDGPFIALHLRYEKDMLAFSGCTYGLSDSEIDELTMIRENTPYWKVKQINSTEQRLKGLCPLTPKEVGIFLQALQYPSSTRIYIAAGEIYGNGSMNGLQTRFPNLMRKETIATTEELAPFIDHATQLAALDYIVSVESDVFVPSYAGNMARAVEGHRRFLGHRKTISPDRRRLVELFNQLDQASLLEGDDAFASTVVEMHSKRQGAPRRRKGPSSGSKGRERFRTEEAFYTNPLPDCLCLNPSNKKITPEQTPNNSQVILLKP